MKQLYHLVLIVLIVATCLTNEALSAPSQVVKREAVPHCMVWQGMKICLPSFLNARW
uniref:Uncharacterized protein n=1 Tax=Anopheles coluzzii TaxID=1518534 RepID=A0A6E8W838_ANOCL